MLTPTLPEIIVILGPTAAGKTALAIKLAKKFNGEIISADSRQIYKYLKIGSGQPNGRWKKNSSGKAYLVKGVPHYLMAVFDPGETVTVADFKKLALKYITDITRRGKLPILTGGTGLYIQALVDNWEIPSVAPDAKLRQRLAGRSLTELVAELKRVDPISESCIDVKNRRRVERALEVAIGSGQSFFTARTKGPPLVRAIQIGLFWKPEALKKRIRKRLRQQWAAGFISEAKKLFQKGYLPATPGLSGIGYAEIAGYLQGEYTLRELQQKVATATWRYAKRQMTWFKRDKRVHWLRGDDFEAAKKLVAELLTGARGRE